MCALLVVATACGDATGPVAKLDPQEIGDVMPAVIDALHRIAPGIESDAYRGPTTASIADLVEALEILDQNLSRFHVRQIGTLMLDYRAREPDMPDDSEVAAIELMLNAVTLVIGGGYQLPVQP